MANKTEPKSLRFNKDHLSYALEITGQKNEQKLIDKILQDFWDLGHPIIKFTDGILKTSNPVIIEGLRNHPMNFDNREKPAENSKLKEYQDELELLKDQNTPLAVKRKKWLSAQIVTLS